MSKSLLKYAAVALLAPLGVARADLQLIGPTILGGTGLGAVNTVLTVQNSPSERGSVCYSAGGDVLGGTVSTSGVCSGTGDDKTGASQTQTRVLGSAGVTAASNFAILFNIAEPGSDVTVALNSLFASFYNSTTGAFLFQAGCNASCNLGTAYTQQGSGVGNSGYQFALTASEAATLQGLINTNGGVNNVRVGLAMTGGGAGNLSSDGASETFFVYNNAAVTATPEPSTTVLVATGLAGLVGMVRRRRRS